MTTQQDGKLIKHTTRSNICLGSKVHAVLSDDSDIICKAIKKKKATVDILMLLYIYPILGSQNTMSE